MAAGSIIIDMLLNTGSFETDTQRASNALKRMNKDIADTGKNAEQLGYKFDSLFNVWKKVEGAQNSLTTSMQKSQAGFRASNQIMQQASYQITDFVVQVSGGVSAVRAFGQQAPQLLAAFGGVGAAIGTVVALGAAFVPMLLESIGATKSFDDAMKRSEDALSGVATASRTFDMTPVIKQFNDADAATRESIIQLMNYKKALIDVTNIDLKKSFSEQVSGLSDTGFFGQFSDAMPSARFAEKMGISVNKEMYADLRVLRYEYGSVQEFADKYATTLTKGNEEGRKFAKMVIEMARSLKEGEMATKAINEAQNKMFKAGASGIIQTKEGKPVKTDNTLQKMFENQRVGADKFVESMQRSNEQIEYQTSLLGRSSQEVELLNMQYRIEAELQKTIQDLQRQNGTIAEEEMARMKAAAEGAIAVQTAMITSRQEKERSAEYGMQRGFQNYIDTAGNAAKNIEQVFSNAFKGMEDGLVQFAMTGKMSFSNFANSVISDIMRIYIRMMIAGLVGKVAGAFATPTSTQVPEGADLYQWLAAGGGGNVHYDGGYTGDGGKYEAAGTVHKGEFVMTKEATSRIGVGNLYKMMRGYANGGYVGSSMPIGGGGNVNINITNEAGGDGYQATATARKNDTGFDVDILVRKALNNDLRNNGPMSQTLSATYGLSRRTR